MNTDVMFSSRKQEWGTPQDLFNRLDEEFCFTVDVCANADNAKCGKYWTEEDDGLSKSWEGERCFMNPPYGREISKWVEKARFSNRCTVVCLLPARTDTRWFHDYILGVAEIRFIKGRLRFQGAKNSAPFPSMIVIYRNYFLRGMDS